MKRAQNKNSLANLRTRPPFEPTAQERKQVESMAGYGVPHEGIACMIRDGIDEKTLRKRFRRELDVGKAKAHSKIGQTLFQQAMNGNIAAAIWFSKAQMGWKETGRQELTGADGKPLAAPTIIIGGPGEPGEPDEPE